MRKLFHSPGREPMTSNLESLRGYQLDHRGDRDMWRVEPSKIGIVGQFELGHHSPNRASFPNRLRSSLPPSTLLFCRPLFVGMFR